MVIHSVTPSVFLSEQPELPEFTWRKTEFGHVQGYDTPGGFCVSRIYSTDPGRYLSAEYAPGAILRGGSPKNTGR